MRFRHLQDPAPASGAHAGEPGRPLSPRGRQPENRIPDQPLRNQRRLIRHPAGRPYSTVLIGVGALVATVALPVVLLVRAPVF